MDINPSNIMITAKTNDVKLIDLGFCYSDSYQDTVGCTKNFCAQEASDCSHDYDVRTDIYAVGKIIEYIKDNGHVYLSPKYRHIMANCLRKDKKKRYQSVNDIINYLKGRSYLDRILINTIIIASILYAFFALDGLRRVHNVIYGYDFVDYSGLKVNILSDGDQTCGIVGYDASQDQRPRTPEAWQIVIPEKISYKDKWYEVHNVADASFEGDSCITMLTVLAKDIIIGNSAFKSCSNLRYVSFSLGKVTLMPNSFSDLHNLRIFDFPISLINIPYVCFTGTQLKTISLPEGLITIDQDAFVGNDSLTAISLPHTLQQIGRGVFYHNSNLMEVHIPPHVRNIGMFCFMECPRLKYIYNESVEPQNVSEIFDKNAHITVYVPRQSVDKYRKANVWKDQDIQPLP